MYDPRGTGELTGELDIKAVGAAMTMSTPVINVELRTRGLAAGGRRYPSRGRCSCSPRTAP